MATIRKRNNKNIVVYWATDANGEKKQYWEPFDSLAKAKRRKAQVEFEQSNGTFVCPTVTTVKELMKEYVRLYGVNKWAPSTYSSKMSIINNYINPYIGDMKISDLTPLKMSQYYVDLTKKYSVAKPHQDEQQLITPRTVLEVHKILRNALNLAVGWELLARNPVQKATLPKSEEKERDIWDHETLIKAMEACDDPTLSLCIHVAFSCSLRMGELLGLTWDCVDISEASIKNNRASIYVNKEMQRIEKDSLEAVGDSSVFFQFPTLKPKATTVLVLKSPKTKTSVRRVYLPKTVAEMLVEQKKEQDYLKDVFGEEYEDYNLVICYPNGRPMESSKISKMLDDLIQKNNLPKVVFHSLRHSSTTYKLKLTGGDIKAVQGDTGHAQATMVTERYAHIMDDDRRVNAERFEKAFYGKNDFGVRMPFEEELDNDPKQSKDAEEVASLLADSPELLALVKAMLTAKK